MFENDDPAQRSKLIDTLNESGLDAWEFNSGGGIMHVIVTLLDFTVDPPIITAHDPELKTQLQKAVSNWPEAYLYIATNSLNTDCEIGLMGADGATGGQIEAGNWLPVDSLENAVLKFQGYWHERDKWLRGLLTSEYAIL